MSLSNEEGAGVCILSFDSGGPGTYSQLLILKECMSRLASDLGIGEDRVYAADYFDIMGGVGFGGLAAVALGCLRMTIEEAIDALLTIASTVFPEDSRGPFDTTINTYNLKEALEDLVQARGVPIDAKMCDTGHLSARCKVILFAATSANLSHPQAFRTYPSRGSSLNPTIIEAVCASMAIPSHFIPVKIGLRLRQQSFVGGALGANNPTRELLKEANAVFGNEKRVAHIFSLGAGRPRMVLLKSSTAIEKVGQLVKVLTTDCEMIAQELSTRLYNVDAYIRLNVEAGMEDIVMDDWSVLGDIESQTRAYIDTKAVMDALEVSVRHLRERIGTATLSQLVHSSTIKSRAKKAPALSPYYTFRKKASEIMVYHLVTSPPFRLKIFCITGMAGCGKTQIVSYFLQEYSSLYSHVVFVDATSSTSIKSDLQAWARSLGDEHERDTWEDAIGLLSATRNDQQSALILDNADDPALDLVPFIPIKMIGVVMITSRNRNQGNLSTTHHLELGEMEEEEALSVLLGASRRRQPLPADELTSAYVLMRELGYLAVALVQAGTYCHELSSTTHGMLQPYTFTQYLSLFYSHHAELMRKTEPSSLDSYRKGVYTTLELSYEAVPPTTRDFLHFISYFHNASIPLAALTVAANENFQDISSYLPRPASHDSILSALMKLLCSGGNWSELQIQEMIRTLRSFSLLTASSVNDHVFLHLHPLVQSWSRDTAASLSLQYTAMVTQVLTTCANSNNLRLYRYLIPHLVAILGRTETPHLHVNDQMAAGTVFRHQGHYHTAVHLFKASLEAMNQVTDANDSKKSVVNAWLASTYSRVGRWSEAELLQSEVLEHRRMTVGPEHPDTIMAAANLAVTYWEQGRWGDAERLEMKVLDQRKEIMEIDDPDLLLATANLASTYHAQRRWDDAEKLELTVLDQRLKIYGPDDPETITAAANLAVTYWAQGKWGEAEKLEVIVLENRQKLLDLDHPDTILATANLASTYHAQGRWGDAEILETTVLGQRRRILGTDHPDTILAAANLAATYHGQRKWKEAELLGALAMEQRGRVLGMEHPDTILATAMLAATYCAQDRWEEARGLLVPAVELSLRVVGQKDPSTQNLIRDLVAVHEALGGDEDVQKIRELLLP